MPFDDEFGIEIEEEFYPDPQHARASSAIVIGLSVTCRLSLVGQLSNSTTNDL